MRAIAVTLTSLTLCLLATTQASVAAEYNPALKRPAAAAAPVSHRFIVKMRSTADSSRLQAQASDSGESASATAAVARVQAMASRTHVNMTAQRMLTANLHVMQVTSGDETEDQTLAKLRADSDVEYAVLDRRVYPHATTPSDPGFTNQWYLQAAQPAAINAIGAWDTSKGSDSIVIAVIDTGVRFDHPDLTGRLLAGYDFVSPDGTNNFKTANDSDGRDSDASDPGDWVATADNCGATSASSWHGTRTSGIIGAMTNNGLGVSGVTWNSKILPVRVLGKCGGFNSDVLAGMLWAAGEHVDGVPDNTNPARVLNISLGGEGACDSASAQVTSLLSSKGVLIVVSAGNEGGPVDSPANCPGAMGILGLRHAGTKVGFSSLGPEIALGAPGGNCVNTGAGQPCIYSIDTTTNNGTTTPTTSGYTDQLNYNVGTSFSAPIVSGIAGLMLGVNSNLRSTTLIARLKEGASPYPTVSDNANVPICHTPANANDVQGAECICTTSVCGAGMANANGAVQAALRPIADIAIPGAISAGATLTLQGNGSSAANGHSIATYSWTKGGQVISTGPTASVVAPSSGTQAVCLTVVDDAGKQDSIKVVISPSSSSTTISAGGTNTCLADVTVTATDASASEAGGDTGTFTLSRTGDTTSALGVTVALSGSAVNGTDYQAIATTVTFAAGSATATVTLTPIDNSVAAGSKTATLAVSSGTGYNAGSPSSATVTIADNDTAQATSNGGGGGGGGGALDPLVLMGLALAVLAMLARARLPRGAQYLRQHVAAEQRRARR